MALEWQFFLDTTEIEYPVGFEDIVFKVERDETWHGILVEATATTLSFYGEAFDYLKSKKEQYGVDAEVVFTADVRCEGGTSYENAIEGKLNFGRYKESCGTECMISMTVEQVGCTMLLKNRFDQKVNVDSPISFNGTILPQYNGLGFEMDLAAQEIPISADASVELAGDSSNINVTQHHSEKTLIRPIYLTVRDNSIATGELDTPANFYQDPQVLFSLSPQVLLEEPSVCISQDWDYSIRLKGTIRINHTGAHTIDSRLVVGYWDGITGTLIDNITELHTDVIQANMANGVTYSFDRTYASSFAFPLSSGIYAYIEVDSSVVSFPTWTGDIITTFDDETSFFLENTKSCPPTDAKVYLVHETLSRVTEVITDRCLTVESDYYGRTDSEPYAASADGCGSLRVLTSGLRIRQADKDYFLSLKEALEGLKAIDNIGMGIEDDKLRIEPVEYFYQNVPILTIDLIPKADTSINENLIFTLIKVGYNKWEIKSVKGIDEFNSLKEFRTGIKSVSRTLDITSNLITAGYIIETLRSSTLAVSGNADSTYDNDSFLICVARSGAAYYQYEVEQGIIDNPDEMFSPSTAYNWRVRPFYNLMRWAKSIFPAYPILGNTTSKIFFSSGTGNYEAEGNLNVSDDCRLENKTLAENSNLSVNDFDDPLTPIWKPETIEFDYALSIAEYKMIKANPYGYINLQCGTGDYQKAFIKTIDYKPSSGTATFNLLLKWQ